MNNTKDQPGAGASNYPEWMRHAAHDIVSDPDFQSRDSYDDEELAICKVLADYAPTPGADVTRNAGIGKLIASAAREHRRLLLKYGDHLKDCRARKIISVPTNRPGIVEMKPDACTCGWGELQASLSGDGALLPAAVRIVQYMQANSPGVLETVLGAMRVDGEVISLASPGPGQEDGDDQ